MNVNFYTFTKRINSTAQPSGGTSYSCILKEPTSVAAPEIALIWNGSSNPTAYNYAYIADFRRYYWVNNWTYKDRQWVARLAVDPLASFKSEIGASAKYVLRAASDYDPEAIDTLYPATADYAAEGTISGTDLGWDVYGSGGGAFVVTVVGDGNPITTDSAVSMFQMSGTSVQTLITNQLNAVEGAWNNTTATDIFESLKNILRLPARFTTDLSQYIRNIMWFPFTFDTGSYSDVYLGMYKCSSTGLPISKPIKTFSGSVDLSSFPGTLEPWECMAPYGNYYLEFQPFGIIPIPAAEVVLGGQLNLNVRVDAASGLGLLQIEIARGLSSVRRIAARTAQIGVAVPYGGTAPNYAGAITGGASVLATAAAYAQGEASGGALAASIGSAVASSSPNGYSSGTSGGGAALIGASFLHYTIYSHVSTDPTENGRPLAAHRMLNTLSGFIQCRDGDIPAPATSDRKSVV